MLTVVGLLQLDGRNIAVDLEEPVLVEPVDPVQGGGFQLVDGAPGATTACAGQVIMWPRSLGSAVGSASRRSQPAGL